MGASCVWALPRALCKKGIGARRYTCFLEDKSPETSIVVAKAHAQLHVGPTAFPKLAKQGPRSVGQVSVHNKVHTVSYGATWWPSCGPFWGNLRALRTSNYPSREWLKNNAKETRSELRRKPFWQPLLGGGGPGRCYLGGPPLPVLFGWPPRSLLQFVC